MKRWLNKIAGFWGGYRRISPTTTTTTLDEPPVRTAPLPSDHDHAKAMGTALVCLTISYADTPTAPTKSDAVDDAAEWRFSYSVSGYSHADWKRKQHAEPT